jgi:hypothetical protein
MDFWSTSCAGGCAFPAGAGAAPGTSAGMDGRTVAMLHYRHRLRFRPAGKEKCRHCIAACGIPWKPALRIPLPIRRHGLIGGRSGINMGYPPPPVFCKQIPYFLCFTGRVALQNRHNKGVVRKIVQDKELEDLLQDNEDDWRKVPQNDCATTRQNDLQVTAAPANPEATHTRDLFLVQAEGSKGSGEP